MNKTYETEGGTGSGSGIRRGGGPVLPDAGGIRNCASVGLRDPGAAGVKQPVPAPSGRNAEPTGPYRIPGYCAEHPCHASGWNRSRDQPGFWRTGGAEPGGGISVWSGNLWGGDGPVSEMVQKQECVLRFKA